MGNSTNNGPLPTGDVPPQEWIAQMFARLEVPLVGYAARHLRGDLETARDVVQEAFVKLCQQPWPEIEPQATAWLYRTCRNRAIDLNRREGRMSTTTPATDVSQLPDQHDPPPHLRAELTEQIDRVRLQLDQLPDRQQELLRLRLHENLSYKQIAEVTGLTATNVGYLLHQAIATLRAKSVMKR